MLIDHIFQNAFKYEAADMRAGKSAAFLEVGASLLLFPLLVFVLTTLWFAVGGAISPVFAWGVLITSAAGAMLLSHFTFKAGWRFAPLVTLSLGILAILASLIVHDTSMDGQHYHFQAFYALAEGWNPIHGNAPPPVIGDPITLWAIHYPRAGWLFSANLLSAGFPLAAAKSLNFLALFASAALIGGMAFRMGFSRLMAILLAAVAILNPVVLSQLFTSMNDGLFGHCMIVFAISVAGWIHYGDRRLLFVGIAAMMLALNLKFSAIPIFVMLCAAACAGAFIARGQQTAILTGAALLSSAFVAIILLGWSPYMQNYLEHGHVFHPIMGEQAVNIMTGEGPALDNTPDVLTDKSGVERFFFSLFSETHSGFYTLPELKFPFTISPAELRASGGVDIRLGGFGPLFSGILILAVIGVLGLVMRPARRNPATVGLLFAATVFIVSVLIMPQNWWARYVPQFWFVPALIAAASLTTNKRALQVFGAVIAGVMLLNAALVGAAGFWLTETRNAEASAQIARLAETGEAYCIYPDMVQSRIQMLREAGIKARYTPEADIACSDPEEIAAYGPDRFGGKICPCPE
jgi:hypothetical protein